MLAVKIKWIFRIAANSIKFQLRILLSRRRQTDPENETLFRLKTPGFADGLGALNSSENADGENLHH